MTGKLFYFQMMILTAGNAPTAEDPEASASFKASYFLFPVDVLVDMLTSKDEVDSFTSYFYSKC